MAAILAKNGKIAFTADGDTHTPIANLAINSITLAATTAGTYQIRRLNVTGDILWQVIVGANSSFESFPGGCINTGGGLYFASPGTGTCTVYVK